MPYYFATFNMFENLKMVLTVLFSTIVVIIPPVLLVANSGSFSWLKHIWNDKLDFLHIWYL